MRISLVFCPFSSFSYIPLGIAYLKGYVEKNIPRARVSNLDLSNNFYHNLGHQEFSDRLRQLCRICPKGSQIRCRGILKNKQLVYWLKLAAVTKECIADTGAKQFRASGQYNSLRGAYDLFYRQVFSCLMRLLRSSLEFPDRGKDSILERDLFRDDLRTIILQRPKLVGFSVFSQSQLYYSLALAKILKRKIGCQIVFGGAYIAHLAKKEILENFDFIDFVIYKEAELGLAGLLANLRQNNFQQVPNLVYRSNQTVLENPEVAIGNLDQIPFPDFSDFNLNKYFSPQPVLSTLFSRGCFWGNCSFCAHHKTYSRPYRSRSVSNLISEIRSYQKKGIKHISFADEIIKPSDLDRISEVLVKQKINIHYDLMLRPTKEFTYALLKRMHRSGCKMIIWGVESFNQKILDLMNKGTNAPEIVAVLKNAQRAGISNIVYMIQGFPRQTENDILKDREILRKNSRYFYDIGIHDFWLEDGTAIFRNPAKFGLSSLKKDYLLKAKRHKLFSHEILFKAEQKINRPSLNRLLSTNQMFNRRRNGFMDSGFLFSKEHMLLHLSR